VNRHLDAATLSLCSAPEPRPIQPPERGVVIERARVGGERLLLPEDAERYVRTPGRARCCAGRGADRSAYDATAVLVTFTDQPGMLFRLTKVLADHSANITHVDLTYPAAPENPIR
jgi:hypothetical protein